MTTAFYLRLSLADGDLGKEGKDESNSIENQRELLEHHVEAHEELSDEIIEYIDDGYTGTNFERPAFRRMIEDAKRGKFQTIIVKDLSRLGRDYIGVGDYIDQIFPVLGIRLIAVNSNYDSNKYAGQTLGLDMTVTNLVNTMYSRDISKKVRSGIESRWRQGKTTCGNPPYGFLKDDSAKGGWAIDPVAGAVVRKMFDKALEGYNTKDIANYLNEKNIPTPGKYRRMSGRDRGKSKVKESEILWTTTIVLSIIQRYEYCGAFVHNKRSKIRVGSRETRAVPEHDRIIIEDAHDAIITKEEFYQAQNIRQKQMKKKAYRVPLNYPLKGKIFCGNCRLALAYQVNVYEPIFYCMHAMAAGNASKCCRDFYSERIIEETVYSALCRELKKIQVLHSKVNENSEHRSLEITKQICNLQKEAEIKRAERVRSYEAFADGHISKEKYMKKKAELTADVEKIDDEISKLIAENESQERLHYQFDSIYRMADSVISKGHLTEEFAELFLDTVYVYDSEHIEVIFKFEDALKEAVEKCEKDGEATS